VPVLAPGVVRRMGYDSGSEGVGKLQCRVEQERCTGVESFRARAPNTPHLSPQRQHPIHEFCQAISEIKS